jgi:flagellin-like protein
MAADRGVSSVVATVLLIAVVLIIAVTAGVYALDFADSTRDPSPQMHATLQPIETSDGEVVVRKNGGEDLNLTELQLVIRNEDTGQQARLVSLPSAGNNLSPSNVQGASIVSTNVGESAGEILAGPAATDGVWEATESVTVTVESLSADDRITVKIIHTPTNAIIWEDSENATA